MGVYTNMNWKRFSTRVRHRDLPALHAECDDVLNVYALRCSTVRELRTSARGNFVGKYE